MADMHHSTATRLGALEYPLTGSNRPCRQRKNIPVFNVVKLANLLPTIALALCIFSSESLALSYSVEPIPEVDRRLPAAIDYVEDSSGILPPERKESLVHKLRKFERETSNQIVVAIIPELPAGYALEGFTQQAAESWYMRYMGNDTIVLFVFPNSKLLRIEIGSGLEGSIPAELVQQIIQSDITPFFKKGDIVAGIEHGVDSLLAASNDKHRGSWLMLDPLHIVGILICASVMLIASTLAFVRAYYRRKNGESLNSNYLLRYVKEAVILILSAIVLLAFAVTVFFMVASWEEELAPAIFALYAALLIIPARRVIRAIKTPNPDGQQMAQLTTSVSLIIILPVALIWWITVVISTDEFKASYNYPAITALETEEFDSPLDKKLATAIARNNRAAAKALVAKGANPEAVSKSGKNLFWWAAAGDDGGFWTYRWLIRNGVRIQSGSLPFILQYGPPSATDPGLLVAAGADYSEITPEDMKTIRATTKYIDRHLRITDFLLDGMEPNHIYPSGETLISALFEVYSGEDDWTIADMIMEYLEAGGSPDSRIGKSQGEMTVKDWCNRFIATERVHFMIDKPSYDPLDRRGELRTLLQKSQNLRDPKVK